ncbi:HSP90 family protein [Sphingobacterium sp. LRF_L2]|uniref:HSP90 family protein n=1 Tax=Sphingobacterium sp. LRF_L2 TaxID=3369421 RepID=UPI003F5EDD89
MQHEKSYSFQVNLRGMIALLSEHLYSDPNTFLRELLQNATDAITAIKYLDEQHQGEIKVHLPKGDNSQFIFQDNGIGLKESEIHQFLAVIGESSKGKDVYAARDFIGKFGIGLLSCFVVSDQIVIETKSALEQVPLRWIANAEGDYAIEALETDMPIGTRVILTPKEQYLYIFEKNYITTKLRFYGDALREKISLISEEGCDELNTNDPLWLKKSSDKNELLDVGKRVFNVNFLDAVSFSTNEGECQGVLYILPFKTQFSTKQQHRVYLKRMFLSDEDQGLLPSWAFFVRMLVNTEALSATASRESLMKNESLRNTRSEIALILKDYLKNVKQIDLVIYTKIIQTHFLHLKAFALEDMDFLDIFLDDIPFETNRGLRNFKNIVDYQDIAYYCQDFEDFKQIDRMADTQNLLLINASYTFDTELLKKIRQRYPVYQIKEMSPSTLLDTFLVMNKEEETLWDKFFKQAQRALDLHACRLELRKFQPKDTPAIFTKAEQSNFESTIKQLKENANPFAKMLKASNNKRTEIKPILCLNVNNELIQSIKNIDDDYLLHAMIDVLYVQAMILGKYQVGEREMKIMNEALKNLMVMGMTNFANI